MGGLNGDSETTTRYAPYIESGHHSFLNTMSDRTGAIAIDSPYSVYIDIIIDDAFFGAGYLISSFSSLYDMYGKFMAGLDIDNLFSTIFEKNMTHEEIDDLIQENAIVLDKNVNTKILPGFQTNMRQINAVVSSSFVLGKAVIEDARVKAQARFSAEMKYRRLPGNQFEWKAYLNWNKEVITSYARTIKLYYSAKTDGDNANYSIAAKDSLWPFTVYEYERAAIGALQGSIIERAMQRERSDVSKALLITSYAVTGMQVGAAVGGPWGMVIGFVVGAIIGLAVVYLE